MSRLVSSAFGIVSLVGLGLAAACSGGDISVGKTNQQLQTKKDGSPTGDGLTCSWQGTYAYDTAPGGTTPTDGSRDTGYSVGDDFVALDGCNECSCTKRGIMCTLRKCEPQACTDEAKLCPDGSSVGRTGPNCEFAECPTGPGQACTGEAKLCPDGSSVSRTGPNCEFAECPTGPGQACPSDAKLCPDGSSVTRTGPSCEFPECPNASACPADAKLCPDGSYVSRTGPKCEFAPCP